MTLSSSPSLYLAQVHNMYAMFGSVDLGPMEFPAAYSLSDLGLTPICSDPWLGSCLDLRLPIAGETVAHSKGKERSETIAL